MRIAFKISGIILLLTLPLFARQGHLIPNPIRSIPKWVRKEFAEKDLGRRYAIIFQLYPYFFSGDFNGDGRKDVAIQIEDKRSGKSGIAIFHGKKVQAISTPVSIIAAGNSIGTFGDDLRWATTWEKIQRGHHNDSFSKHLPAMEADAIRLGKRDGQSGVIYWTGKQYAWKELGK